MDWFVQQIAENMDSSNSKLMPLSSFKKQTERTSVSQEFSQETRLQVSVLQKTHKKAAQTVIY